MRKIVLTGCVPGLALALSNAALAAGGHYAVDDATLIDPGRCAVEAWYARADGDNDDVTVIPACNLTGNLELGLGLSRLQEAGERDTVVEFAAKTLFRELEPGGWGWGLAVASTWGGALERHEGAVAYLPLSVHAGEALVLHGNLGWAYERDDDDAAIWGVGADYGLTPWVNLIAETYGSHRGGTELQVGLRFGIADGALDLSYGRSRADAGDDWVTVGFAWDF